MAGRDGYTTFIAAVVSSVLDGAAEWVSRCLADPVTPRQLHANRRNMRYK